MSGIARCEPPSGAVDLAGTPWRWVLLSARRDVRCLVDAADYGWIVAHTWNIGWHRNTPWKYYAKRNVGAARATVYLHREILRRADPREADFVAAHHGDHQNGNALDNRRANLRWLTPAQNRAHQVPRLHVPTLDQIVERLMRQWAAAGAAAQEIPF